MDETGIHDDATMVVTTGGSILATNGV